MRRKRSKKGSFRGSEAAELEREREKLPHQQVCLPGEAGKASTGSLSSQYSSALVGKALCPEGTASP